MNVKYGIDFGTTNSSIAFRYAERDGSEHTIVADLQEDYPRETIPSVVCICENGSVYVGKEAYERARKLRGSGTRFRIIKKIKMALEESGADVTYTVGSRVFDAVDLIAEIFKRLKKRADEELREQGAKATGVVLGVPVEFGDIQKNALKDALVRAGFYKTRKDADKHTEFVSEPVAVAVHHGLHTTDNKTVLVFDFGGGTLDLAIINLKDQVGIDHLHPHEVIAKKRAEKLGGEDLTKLLFEKVLCGPQGYGTREICRAFALDKRLTPDELWRRLSEDDIGFEFLREIELCKCELSTQKSTVFSFLNAPRGIGDKKLFRDYFEDALADVLEKIDATIDACLDKGGIDDVFDIDHVIIAGGSSLIPCVQDLLKSKFGDKKVSTKPGSSSTNSKEVLTSIVRGLAAVGCREESLVNDVVDNDYGIWIDCDNYFLPIIRQGTPVLEASYLNKGLQEGIYREVETERPDQQRVSLKIYQHNLNGDAHLGTITLEKVGGRKYRIFMHIDPKQGQLVVDVYDFVKKKWFDDIPLNTRQYSIG